MIAIMKDIEIKQERRICKVGDRNGYFHTWEQYSKPLPASPLMGGEPAGVFSKVFGIVEFSDGIERIDPSEITFCDEEHYSLYLMDTYDRKEGPWKRMNVPDEKGEK